ncbi:MAG: hypothetical protein IT353_04450 [Gemmatimonadaceae bacterium]|nr:hypothetical protein [Gemmatimonadaceae bacterium]
MLSSVQSQARRAVTRAAAVASVAGFLAACGGEKKAEEATEGVGTQAKNAVEAMGQLAKMGSNLEASADAAAKFQADRKARGDTVVLSYTELQKFLPDAPSGYKAAEEPGGSSQSMGSFAMSEADQKFIGEPDAEGNTPTIRVKLVDFGGTEGAYGMLAMPMMLNMKQEDAHRRSGTVKLSPEFTWATEEYNKDNKDAKLTAITRYRYVITVEAENQREDQTEMVKALTEKIVRRFEGK